MAVDVANAGFHGRRQSIRG